MDEDGALFDARFDDGGPFRDTPEPGGISLDSALRDFGPAALDDLIPRVRALARALDAAHSRGVVHGALNPSKIVITDAGTSIVKGGPASPPYLAPEVVAGKPPSAAADQFSLAAITYEWLFGKRIEGGEDVHGTGCALSSAIATYLAHGRELVEACQLAKQYVAGLIENPAHPGRGASAVV